ncbi:MAG: S8 family peptidase [Candidatus Saccharicenans sp.]|nr:S8 family peptidase [Candidatus Saccharicenans sp.]
MAEHPLLIFPAPLRSERLKRTGSAGRKVKVPDARQQASRLAPQFQRLQEAMQNQRFILQSTSLGIQPEQTLVLETVGSVERFINAVKRISGLEWLGELELTDIDPGDGFEDERDPDKKLTGQLFLIMTDQRALDELLSLFNKWREDPEAPFPMGLAPMKDLFRYHLRTIRPWDAQDRIRDTGLWEDWKERIEHGQETVPFEVELWYRNDPNRRQKANAYLENVVQTLGGEITSQCVIPEIAYHGVLGRIPIKGVSQFLSQVDTLADFRLFKCEDIMYVHPVGQCAIRMPEDVSETQHIGELVDSVLPRGEPIVALFDGLPLTKHRLLDGRLIVDDPDGFESAYQAKERVHGTAMASLICHGDLNDHEAAIERPVYVRPIMQPRRGFDGRFTEEAIPVGILPIDLIHRAVRRLYESDGGEGPVAPSVRVINLSIGDRSKPLDRMMSAWARLLDWLSWKYNILFMVSAGNHPHDIELDVPCTHFPNLTADEREKAVIKALALNTRHRRLLSPAETINGLTIGSAHADASSPSQNFNLIDPFTRMNIPSVYSAHGPGYRRSIKPDILLPGGRQFLREKLGNTHRNAVLETTSFVSPPGQCVAAPGAQGRLDRTWYMRGTSNAAALASRWANRLYEVLERLRKEFGAQIPSEYDTVLIKTLLVHGADWVDIRTLYESCLRNPQNSGAFREYVTRFIGYGFADVTKVIACTDQRVTIMGFGKLEDGQADEFHLPLPPTLSARNVKRRLTITLAWLTPVNSRHHRYRIAHLWFDPKNSVVPHRIDADGRAVQRGTVQHEVLEGEQAADFQDGDAIVIKVNCRADAGDIPEFIRYGLAVTLEVAEDIAIYQEVRERLYVRIPVHGGSTT